jgi:anhydro-N-acetylmuramic acid kinase
MPKREYLALGLMSGTSLDGLDIALVRYSKETSWKYEVLKTHFVAYTKEWKERLESSIKLKEEALTKLDSDYGRLLGIEVRAFLKESKTKPQFIASHGHTVFHQPENGFTLQIGSGAQIASIAGVKTICDFRSTDVALGGQGAPLVPVADKYLFSKYDACINIGGFANVSFPKSTPLLGFDICPVNVLLNTYAQKVGQEYDKDGLIAAKGNLNKALLTKLLEATKGRTNSLGVEWVEQVLRPLLAINSSVEDIITTLTRYSAESIASVLTEKNCKTALLTGGGTLNTYLIEQIKDMTACEILVPEKECIEFKEAIAFGFLGVLRMEEVPNVYKSVTGASRDSVSGAIYL